MAPVVPKPQSSNTESRSTPAITPTGTTQTFAASYALLGKMDEAKPYVAETLRVNPSFTIKWFREHAEDIPKRTEGLRKAGFAEE